MRRLPVLAFTSLLALFAARPLSAGEHWQVMQIGGADAGYIHSTTAPGEKPGETLSTVETEMRLGRLGSTIQIKMVVRQWENEAGQLTRIESDSDMSKQRTLSVGVIDGGKMKLTTTVLGKDHTSTIDWPADVPGAEELRRRTLATGFKEGAEFTVWQFDPQFGKPIEAVITVGGAEEVDLPIGKQRLHRLTTHLESMGIDSISWVDDTGEALKTSVSMVGIKMDTLESDREHVAHLLDSDAGGATPEVFSQSVIRSNVRLPRPRTLTSILYRITPKSKKDALPEFEDERQHVESKDPATGAVMLRIDSVVPPENRKQQRPMVDAPPELAEYLEPNAMVQSDDPEIEKFAAAAVGEETDAWKAAQKLELAVDLKITNKNMGVGFASASETIRSCEGDCSEHAVLLAAATRAAGIPSRVAMGVVYVGGIFGGHAWTEVSIDGKWYALDATLGRGSADPTHVRLGATSLKGGAMGNMLSGLMRGLGNMDFHMVEGKRGDVVIPFEKQDDSLQVKDGRVADRIEGVTFALPAGFSIEKLPPPVGGADIFRQSTIAKLKNPAGTTVEVISRAVPPNFALDQLGGEKANRVARRISGQDGVVVRKDDSMRAAVIVEDTMYEVKCTASGDDAVEAFEQIVGSLKIG